MLLWASLKTSAYDIQNDGGSDNAMVSSLAFRASEINADRFYGNLAVTVATGIADADATLVAGLNFGTTSFTAARTWTLPASPKVGDSVKIKANVIDASNYLVVLKGSAAHRIDGDNEEIRLESPYAAIELVYVASNAWKVF